MNFILNNNIFDGIISFFLFINSIITGIMGFKELKSKNYEEEKDNINNEKNGLYLFKTFTILIFLILIFILVMYLGFKYNFASYFTLLYFFAFLCFTISIRKKNISDLTCENKMYYVQTTFLYSIFFSSKATSIYLENFSIFSHAIKEYLLLPFLIFKLILFVFFIVINFSILLSNISSILKKQINFIKNKINQFINKSFELSFYNFYFSNNGENKIMLFIDIPIFIILCPISIVINLLVPVLIIFSKFLLKHMLILGTKITHYLDNSSKIILKTMKISTIISLIVVYVIIIYNSDIISEKTKDIYNLIITVILIPLIYDSIKQK